jgi:hypothetical protein
MPRSGQRSVARVAARRAGLLDRERIERVVERGRVAVGWEPGGQKRLLKKGPSCPPGSKVHVCSNNNIIIRLDEIKIRNKHPDVVSAEICFFVFRSSIEIDDATARCQQ